MLVWKFREFAVQNNHLYRIEDVHNHKHISYYLKFKYSSFKQKINFKEEKENDVINLIVWYNNPMMPKP